MIKESDFIVQSFFKRENLDDMTFDELKGHAAEFPYSSIVQYLFTSRLKSSSNSEFPESLAQTALFFGESGWLNYQLSEGMAKGNSKVNNQAPQFDEVKEDIPLDQSAAVLGQDPFEEIAPILPKVEQTIEIPASHPEESQIAFDPYHTVDYFASQGIKVNLDNEKDELSRKVKSFTSWLKTMKRLQPGAESNTGKDIAAILDSNDKEEGISETIFTEAMAEVYVKQGLRDKAMEVYAKLSLQNPANSHIFADKISQIKENRI